jgi:uncharacterized protein (UPF0261 family)
MSVLLIATLDTKGREAQYVRDLLKATGLSVTVADAGVLGQPSFTPDITRDELFRAAGTTLDSISNDRGRAVDAAARGQPHWLKGYGPSVYSAWAVRLVPPLLQQPCGELPVGVPKVMVSTLASGQVRPYVGVRDICMIHSVVDIAGLNRISRRVLANAGDALIGMLNAPCENASDKSLIAATMFGVTTPCVEIGRSILESAGYEVLVFHATGTGGLTMEGLIRDGAIRGVFDVTTTELADELVGEYSRPVQIDSPQHRSMVCRR